MRVLHVNNVAGVASNLVRGLQALGVEAELFQPTIGTYRATRVRRAILPLTRTIEAFQLRRYVRSRRFDIIHIHYARFAYMALITGMPYILHCHGSDLHRDLHRPGWKQLTELAIRHAQLVFYSTPALEVPLRSIRQDGIYLPNPIDTDACAPGLLSGSHLPRVFSPSKVDDFKGFPQILDTIELLWQARPEIHVEMLGFGNHLALAISFLVRHSGNSNLLINDPISHSKMIERFQVCDVVLGHQAQEYPVLNLSELEGMACGKPVVCRFEYPQVFASPPSVLVSRSAQEAVQHILRLLDNPQEGTQIGRDARAWVMTYHRLEQVAQYLLSFYQQ